MEFTLNQSTAPLTFVLVLDTDHITGATGKTPAVTLSKNGAAFAAPAGAVVEIGSGWYKVGPNAADFDTLGALLVHATAAGCDPLDDRHEVESQERPFVAMPGTSSLLLPPVQYTPGAAVDAYFVSGTTNAIGRADTLVIEAVQTAHWAAYGFPMVDVGGGFFVLPSANAFPALPSGTYNRYIRERRGVDPDPNDLSAGADGPWGWNGTVLSYAGTTAADVWSFPSRTLTNYATGVLGSSVVGSTLSILRGDDISFTVSGLGSLAGRTGEKVWFTAKDSVNDLDASALFQVSETSGLKVLNRSVGTANQGSLTVTDATTGVINVTLTAASSAVLPVRKLVPWDVQWRDGSNKIHTLAGGEFTIAGDVTRATA